MTKLKSVLLGLVAACALSGVHAAELTTTFNNTNSWNGNMFDVVTNGQALTVTGLSINLYPGSVPVQVYVKNGTWVGSENAAAAWTLVDTISVTSNGLDVPTFVDVADFTLAAGATSALYITTTDISHNLAYTMATTPVGTIAASNADLSILVGVGTEYLFGDNISPRIWNGTIEYTVSAVPEAETYLMLLAGLGLAGYAARRKQRG